MPEGKGYRVNGRWSLVSGCPHAQWIPVVCLVERDGEVETLASGAPHMRMALVPRENYEILDTWYAGGLRGTGSHDVVLTDEIVPGEHSFAPFVDESRFDSRFGRVPIVATMSAGCASIRLGLARAAIDALVDLALNDADAARVQDLAEVWSAAIMTAVQCRSAVSEIYGIAGASSLYTDSPIDEHE